MKNITKVIAVVAVVASMIVSASADTLVTRINGTRGASPSQDLMVFTKNIDVLVFGANTSTPTMEVGHLWTLSQGKHHLLMGGIYGSHWTANQKSYVEPYVLAKVWDSKGNTLTAKIFGYVPLDGGGTFIGADELSLTHKVGSHIEIGVEGSFFKSNPGDLSVKWGPTARWQGKNTSVSARYLFGGKGADTFRLTLSRDLG